MCSFRELQPTISVTTVVASLVILHLICMTLLTLKNGMVLDLMAYKLAVVMLTNDQMKNLWESHAHIYLVD